MKKLYDLRVQTGSYTTNNGEDKKSYMTIGAIFEGKDRDNIFMKIFKAFNPAGIPAPVEADSITVFLSKPQERK